VKPVNKIRFFVKLKRKTNAIILSLGIKYALTNL